MPRFRLIAATARMLTCVGCVSTLAVASLARAQTASSAEHVVTSTAVSLVQDLPIEDGARQRVLYVAPAGALRGVIVMFPGGADELDIHSDGRIEHGDNFLVRTRDQWMARGYAIVEVDAIDHQSMRGLRSQPAYARVTQTILEFAARESGAPVWVMGTSQGSIAAVNAAAHASEASHLRGMILTESVSVLGASKETVFDPQPEAVRVRSLVVANDDDRCRVAPPSMADDIAKSLKNAPVEVLRVRGGTTQTSNTCGSLSPHGYLGIENTVIDAIVAWMQKS
ncbi:MAG TPA: alpha/beta hydrolase [Pararobbsia sp.]|nr:alpha/beta hydrolase [Pararobbsia sp.]